MKTKRGLENKTTYYIIAGIVLPIAIAGVVYFLLNANIISFQPVEGECIPLVENSGGNKVEVVFFTDNVPKETVDEYINHFQNTPGPFSDNKEKINFYYGGETKCGIVKGVAVYCYSRDLIKKSSICPHDYIIVLSDKEKQIRSSSYINVISINIHNNKNVIQHEFAHAFTNLADEYVPADVPFGAKNCEDQCRKFEKYEDLEGCFEGCGRVDYLRSTENSIMRSLQTDDFGKLNTQLITEDLDEYS